MAQRLSREERREINRKAHLGRPSARKGRTNVEMMGEEKAKLLSEQLSKSHIGILPSEKTRQALSEAQKLRWAREKENGTAKTVWDKISKTQLGRIYPERRTEEDDRRSMRGIEWQTSVFVRDKHTCQDCGAQPGQKKYALHAHHIKSWDLYPQLRFNTTNGITLCNKCHRKRHARIERNCLKLCIQIKDNIKSMSLDAFHDWLKLEIEEIECI